MDAQIEVLSTRGVAWDASTSTAESVTDYGLRAIISFFALTEVGRMMNNTLDVVVLVRAICLLFVAICIQRGMGTSKWGPGPYRRRVVALVIQYLVTLLVLVVGQVVDSMGKYTTAVTHSWLVGVPWATILLVSAIPDLLKLTE